MTVVTATVIYSILCFHIRQVHHRQTLLLMWPELVVQTLILSLDNHCLSVTKNAQFPVLQL